MFTSVRVQTDAKNFSASDDTIFLFFLKESSSFIFFTTRTFFLPKLLALFNLKERKRCHILWLTIKCFKRRHFKAHSTRHRSGWKRRHLLEQEPFLLKQAGGEKEHGKYACGHSGVNNYSSVISSVSEHLRQQHSSSQQQLIETREQDMEKPF